MRPSERKELLERIEKLNEDNKYLLKQLFDSFKVRDKYLKIIERLLP